MEKQEAYIELRRKLDEINESITEAHKFANKHNLAMGQPRSNPEVFEAIDPSLGIFIDKWGDEHEPESYMVERWIGSEVCW